MKATLQYVIVFILFSVTCSYAQIPVITSFSPVSAKVGKTVTITGSGFHANPDSNIVYFGTVTAELLSSSPDQIQVKVPSGAPYGPVSVYTKGHTVFSNLNFVPTFDGAGMNASSFSPNIDFTTNSITCSEIEIADLILIINPIL